MIDSTSPGKDTPTESKNPKPKVSVVIPCYNREKYLGMAIQSVLSQTYTDFELIIVDNNSTDGSLEIAQIAARNDSRVRVLTETANQGAAHALKTGFEAARGEYLSQVDSDDLLLSEALKKTVKILEENTNCGLVHTWYQDIDEYSKLLSPGWRCSYEYSPWQILTVFMLFHFRLFRKSVYKLAGGIDTNFNLIEDWDLCLRMSEITEVVRIPEFLYLYRNHIGSVHTENRLAVIELTRAVIEAALVRRRMSETHWLEVMYRPQYTVKERSTNEIQ